MPWADWQFWIVTGITLACLIPLYRMIRPRKASRAKATLTVSARNRSAPSDA